MSGKKWDIVLAGGKAINSGDVVYKFSYATDLAASGHLGTIQSEQFGTLVYFDWSPVQWEASMDHYTVRVYYPIEVQAGELSMKQMDQYDFKTEPFMNKEYLISYLGQGHNGKSWLTVRLHRKSPPANYHFRIKQYISAESFEPPRPADKPATLGGRSVKSPVKVSKSRKSSPCGGGTRQFDGVRR